MDYEVAWLLKEKYHGQKTDGFFADSTRLSSGEPLAYVIGHIPFLDSTIYLDSKPLIPRTETEFWVSELIKYLKEKHSTSPLHILDLCAGSGCIGIAIAKACPSIIIDFVEIDKQHLATIKKNCQHNGIEQNRFRLFASNLFENLPKDSHYDYIISNPPYIDPAVDKAAESVKKFEPAIALYGGTMGLKIISEIIKSAPAHLNKPGELWLEHEPEQAEAIKDLAKKMFIVENKTDQYQIVRYTKLVLQ